MDLRRLDRLVVPVKDALPLCVQDKVVILVDLEQHHFVEAKLTAGSHADFHAQCPDAIHDRGAHGVADRVHFDALDSSLHHLLHGRLERHNEAAEIVFLDDALFGSAARKQCLDIVEARLGLDLGPGASGTHREREREKRNSKSFHRTIPSDMKLYARVHSC